MQVERMTGKQVIKALFVILSIPVIAIAASFCVPPSEFSYMFRYNEIKIALNDIQVPYCELLLVDGSLNLTAIRDLVNRTSEVCCELDPECLKQELAQYKIALGFLQKLLTIVVGILSIIYFYWFADKYFKYSSRNTSEETK